MQTLSAKCRDWWGFDEGTDPFPVHLEDEATVFHWPAFDAVVGQIVTAIKRRRFLAVAGAACSAKSVAFAEAVRQIGRESTTTHICRPDGCDPSRYMDSTLYTAIKYAVEPPDGSRETAMKRFREDRARQCRQVLERQNAAGNRVCIAINDAHACRLEFLLMAKRIWDDLHGFDRLVSIVLVGQPALVTAISGCREIDERAEVVTMDGLGSSLPDYIDHELARCGRDGKTSPFTEDAMTELGKLRAGSWRETRDHPLLVNNVIRAALVTAFRIKAQAIDAQLVARAIREGGRT